MYIYTPFFFTKTIAIPLTHAYTHTNTPTEKLGPTFVKLGQALSIRPDVIGPAATEELQKLQDAVPPFSNDVAMKIIEEELGRPWTEVFSEMSPEPIAAASLAQVYKGKLVSTGEYVAIKVQRPQMLETVSKDLYVMRRAVEVYQKYIVTRFTAQTTDYQELLQVFATGFYQGVCVCMREGLCMDMRRVPVFCCNALFL